MCHRFEDREAETFMAGQEHQRDRTLIRFQVWARNEACEDDVLSSFPLRSRRSASCNDLFTDNDQLSAALWPDLASDLTHRLKVFMQVERADVKEERLGDAIFLFDPRIVAASMGVKFSTDSIPPGSCGLLLSISVVTIVLALNSKWTAPRTGGSTIVQPLRYSRRTGSFQAPQ
jgi:hypothetical protein